MQGRIFRTRALREARRYGDDDLVLLRELAQNSRDAGARHIDVATRVDPDGSEWLIFTDDGSGMSFKHARSFLFRLYASSKESNDEAAGRFGVGFWSVLRWEPDTILVESRTRQGGWAVALDAHLNDVQTGTCHLESLGTRVALRRPSRAGSAAALSAEVEAGARRYCRYLRRTGRDAAPLPVSCNGTSINEPFRLEGPFSLAFKTGEIEGVVGLGPEPRVELYARGLLVSAVSVLEEIEPGARVLPNRRHVGGMAPVILINSNALEVVLSRQAPRRGRALRRVIRVARRQIRRLVAQLVDDACPEPWWQRMLDRLQGAARAPALRLAGVTVALALTVAAAAVAAFVSGRPQSTVTEVPAGIAWSGVSSRDATSGLRPATVSESSAQRPVPSAASTEPLEAAAPTELPYANLNGYAGATVDVPDAGVVPWGLSYSGGRRDVLFRALTLDHYDTNVGWLRTEPTEQSPYPDFRCRRGCLSVRLQVLAPHEPLVVPLPTGMRLERETLRFAEQPVEALWENEYGEAMVRLPAGKPGVLAYRAGQSRGGRAPAVDAPSVTLPPWLERRVERFARLRTKRRVERVTGLVRDSISYDVSPQAAEAFATAPGDWLSRVLDLKAGDCDVKNGVNVLLLRRLGVPARMAVGIAARSGRARPNLHAWTEYYQGGWRAIDATGVSRPRPVAVVATQDSSVPSVAPAEPPPAAVASAPLPASSTVTTATDPALRSPAAVVPAAAVALEVPAEPWWSRATGPALALLVILLGIVLLRAFALRVRERVVSAGGADDHQAVLARMLRDALAHPEAWRSASSLWRRRVLPTLRGRPLSVAEALRRAIDGVLFVSSRRSDLALAAASRNTPVLDGGHPVFGPVVAALGRTVDLDALSALQPASAGGDDATVFRFEAALEPVNRVLRELSGGIECRICPALDGTPVRDVDLSALHLVRGAPWPRRFIAINPRDAEVRRRARVLGTDPERGVFLWIDWLLDRSQMLARDADSLRERAAAELLEVPT